MATNSFAFNPYRAPRRELGAARRELRAAREGDADGTGAGQ